MIARPLRLSDLQEHILTQAPAADATAARLRFGTALSGGPGGGTYIGFNAANGFTGAFLECQLNGATKARLLGSGDAWLDYGTLYVQAIRFRTQGANAAPDQAWLNVKAFDTTYASLNAYTSANLRILSVRPNGQARFESPGDSTATYQAAIAIQPNGSLLTYWRPLEIYLANSSVNPEVYVDRTGAFVPVRLTTSARNAIASPVAGMFLYDSTLNKLFVYTGSAWEQITSA